MLFCSKVIKQIQINNILLIQTAFVGDVILSTGLPAKLKKFYPQSRISFLVRKGNEGLIMEDTSIDEVLIWNKKSRKNWELFKLIYSIRGRKFDCVVNIQRHFSTGLITVLSGARSKIGFESNPLSRFFTTKVVHDFPSASGIHEIQRNNALIAAITDDQPFKPTLNFSEQTKSSVEKYKNRPYVVIAPASVWFTKQLPENHWVDLINQISEEVQVFLIGAPDDVAMCMRIQEEATPEVEILAGKLSLEASAALIQGADFAFVNDSAPLHMASAVDTPVCAFYCSTLPEFGFYPLSSQIVVGEIKEELTCRPCGLHGKKQCPEGHFNCGQRMPMGAIIEEVKKISSGIFI